MFKLMVLVFVTPLFLFAATTMPFSYNDQEITKAIQDYAKVSGKTFVVDPVVRGKISIYTADKVSVEEAYELLSSALAVNGYAISIQNNTYVVKSARNIQRDLIEVTTKLPTLKPERMVSYIVSFKHLNADDVMRDLRIFPSKDGEMVATSFANQVIFTDWASNLHRIDRTIKEIDRPIDTKYQAALKKKYSDIRKENAASSKRIKMENSDFEAPPEN